MRLQRLRSACATAQSDLRLWLALYMRGARKFCQRRTNIFFIFQLWNVGTFGRFFLFVLVHEGERVTKYHYKRAMIGPPPAKLNLNGASLAGRWWLSHSGTFVFGSSFQLKKPQKTPPPDKTFWIRACLVFLPPVVLWVGSHMLPNCSRNEIMDLWSLSKGYVH